VLQYINNLLTISDKGNDFHGGAAGVANERVYFIDLINKTSPGQAAGGVIRGIIDYGSFGWFFVGYIFSFTSVGIRIIAIVAD